MCVNRWYGTLPKQTHIHFTNSVFLVTKGGPLTCNKHFVLYKNIIFSSIYLVGCVTEGVKRREGGGYESTLARNCHGD